MKRWPKKPLGELCSIVAGGTPSRTRPDFYDGDIPWVKIGDMLQGIVTKTEETISKLGLENSSAKLLPPGTVLISIFATIGRTAVLGIKAATNQAIVGVIPTNARRITPSFLRHFLDCSVTDLTAKARGVAQLNINGKILKSLPVPVPPLEEQERIVKLLDEADELRKLRAQADQRTNALIPALFHEMFADATLTEKTIGQFLDDGWLLLHKDGNHGGLYPCASDFREKGVPFLSATSVTETGGIDHSKVKWLSEDKAKQLQHGWLERNDVLLAHNATVGKVGYYEGDYDKALIGTSLTAFRANPEHIDSRFLWVALRNEFFQQQLERIMKQALRNQVPITAQRELHLRVPQLQLQKEFAARVEEIRAMQAEQTASYKRLDGLFQAMLHRAFEGEL